MNTHAPNIVLIVADYMGYRDIEPYGAQDIHTPALNQLARDGARFTNFYAAAPVCARPRGIAGWSVSRACRCCAQSCRP